MSTGIGGELLWLCPTLGSDTTDHTGLNTVSVDGGLSSIAHTDHGGTRAYSFDGSNDCITIPHHSRFNFGTGDFTVSLHVKPTTSGDADLVHKIMSTGTYAGFTLQRVSGLARFWIYNVSTSQHISRPISIDVWSHILAERRSNQMSLFVNGFCVLSQTANQDVSNSVDMKIGSLAAGGWGGGWFTGLADDIRVFGKVLTAQERGQLATPAFQPSASGTARPSHPMKSQVIG